MPPLSTIDKHTRMVIAMLTSASADCDAACAAVDAPGGTQATRALMARRTEGMMQVGEMNDFVCGWAAAAE
jgi:hypothetical protein